jgi:hypothetical protein
MSAAKLYRLRQQQAAEAGRKARVEKAQAEATIIVPSVNIDKSRITLARLRFMGEEPHPSQLFERESEDGYYGC